MSLYHTFMITSHLSMDGLWPHSIKTTHQDSTLQFVGLATKVRQKLLSCQDRGLIRHGDVALVVLHECWEGNRSDLDSNLSSPFYSHYKATRRVLLYTITPTYYEYINNMAVVNFEFTSLLLSLEAVPQHPKLLKMPSLSRSLRENVLPDAIIRMRANPDIIKEVATSRSISIHGAPKLSTTVVRQSRKQLNTSLIA